VKSGAQDAVNPVHALGTAYTELSGLVDDATGSTDDNTRAVGEASRAISGHTASMKRGRKGALDAAKATEEATDATEDGTKAIEDHAKALEDQRDAQMAATDAILEAADSNLAYRNQAAKTTEAIKANVAAQKDGKLSLEEKAQASRDAEGAAYDLAAAAVRQAQDEAAASGQTLTAAQSARIQKAELERVAAYMDGDARAAIERYIAQLGRIPGDIYTNVRVTRTGDLGPIQRGYRASGGPVAPGGAYVVGEQGPELLQMGSTGGNVVPNNKLGVGGGGGGNTINVYVRGGDPNEVIQAIQRYERRNGPGWRS